jgi:diguanylate cyclase (GGDEF)-like protein/PAS domain S-box-containing protein
LDLVSGKTAEDALLRSEERLSLALRVSNVGIFDHEHGTDTVYWSPELRAIYGWDLDEEITLSDFFGSIYPDDRARVESSIRREHTPDSDERSSGEYRVILRDGELRWVSICIQALFDGIGSERRAVRTLGAILDITEHKLNAEKIRTFAFYDALTQLPNRSLLKERLEQAIASLASSNHHAAILFLDLDNFKILNDTQGHQAGDELLVEMARRLTRCVRETDTVARLGGDEFVVLLELLDEAPDCAETQAQTVADKVLIELNTPYVLSSGLHYFSVSIGIVLFSDPGTSINQVLAQADAAMYQAKKSGKSAYRFFDPVMQRSLEQRTALEKALRQATKKQQLILHYQPQVDTQGRITGAEALIRWQHPELGLIPPAEFIPVAEETGLILEIGAWVLEKACAQLLVWRQNPATAKWNIAVNISARQLYQPGFVEQVREILTRYAIPAPQFNLELTESMVLEDVRDAITKMKQLKSFGIQLSADDFGTGYSSLSYLKQLPFDQIKIDRSFVQGIKSDPNDVFIVSTIIALGQRLDMSVMAEGVEDIEQYLYLQQMGCASFQGYYFGRPASAESLLDFL